MNLVQVRCKHPLVDVVSYDNPMSTEDRVLVRCADCASELMLHDERGSGLLQHTLEILPLHNHTVKSQTTVRISKYITYAE